MVLRSSACIRFEANRFSSARCQHCFKPKDGHSEQAIDAAKMSRKVAACGFLYVAPPNIDFSEPSHSAKRWQRRCFTLYDDGELCYALDDNPETVPQIVMDMRRCSRICEADAITGHSHSILIAFRNGATGNPISDNTTNEAAHNHHYHLPICYMKADSNDEIRRWQSVLQMYAKQNVIHLNAPAKRRTEYETASIEPFTQQQQQYGGEQGKPTVIQVNDTLLSPQQQPQQQQRESTCSSRSSSMERLLTIGGGGGGLSSSRLELGTNRSTSLIIDTPIHHGTPRSVKFRNKVYKDEPIRKAMSVEVPLPILDTPVVPPSPAPPLPESPCPLITSAKLPISTPFNIDTSNAHTLRKGWLMLRGKSESEWTKHWVVLAGLSLKLYKDVWAEDSSEALLSIDLTECDNVYPSASARNYGIEIKCRRTRYILSAMTPGIRDSWIAALNQNLHNPSPTYAETAGHSDGGGASLPDTDILSLPMRKKHIAYVAPESHHSNSMMDEEDENNNSCSEEDEFNSIGSRGLVRNRQPSVSERSLESSCEELESQQQHQRTSRRQTAHRRRSATTAAAVTREQSLSPTLRRSPVSRIKERSNTRQLHGTTSLRRNGSNSSLSSAAQQSERSQRHTSSRCSHRERSASSPQEMRLRSLESQVQSLREQLHDTTCRLGETRTENERLRYLFLSNDARGLTQLRKSLTAAEQDIIKKQQEMESLRQQLVTPTSEIVATPQCDEMILKQMISLLKIQVGALSKFIHSSSSSSSSKISTSASASSVGCQLNDLKQKTDYLVRMVADLDGQFSANTYQQQQHQHRYNHYANNHHHHPIQIQPFIDTIQQLCDAYQQLGLFLNSKRPDTTDRQTSTEEEYKVQNENVEDEVRDLENVIEELQASHADEIESLRLQYEHQVKTLRERADFEEQRRKKAQEELQTLNAMNDHSLETMKKTHKELLEEQKRQYEEEIDLLKKEHNMELEEEKEATRMALDAVQRSHETEIKNMAEKLKTLGSSLASCQPTTSAESRYEAQSARQSKMLEQMSAELAQLSALYSAKCLENSQLDEKMSMLLADKENRSSSTDLEVQNRRLQREIRQKEATIEELRQRIVALEKKLAELGTQEATSKNEIKPSQMNRESRRRLIGAVGYTTTTTTGSASTIQSGDIPPITTITTSSILPNNHHQQQSSGGGGGGQIPEATSSSNITKDCISSK